MAYCRLSVVWMMVLVVAFLLPSEALRAAWRNPVKGKLGMVVSAESLATQAGINVLSSGGNAIDAAIAVGFTLAVTFPEAGNIGGGGFMLIRFADGRSTMIDFREKAPSAATRTMYLDSLGNVIARKSLHGPLAAGVPGSVAGYMLALEKYGTMPRGRLLQPAIDAAERGIRVSERLAQGLKSYTAQFNEFPSTAKVFTKQGEPYTEGELLRQRDLARTLKAIRDNGRDGFYKGAVALKIVAEMKRSGGIITAEDLAAYRAVERTPLTGTYRGYDIITASPPSAGGVVLLQMLNMLEPFSLREKGHNSSAAIHLFVSAAQRAYADRSEFLGDPDFTRIPVAALTSKEYARTRMAGFDSARATPSRVVRPGTPELNDSGETTHFCVADKFGNVVSVTTTINGLYGCKTVVDGAGFFLNNEMDDFVAKPGIPNMFGLIGGDANAIAPHKRMLSSMTPTIVVKDGKPFLTAGARGGSRITTAVATMLINVIDFGMNVQDAVEARRVHYQWLPDKILYEQFSIQQDVMENLRRMGYLLEQSPIYNAEGHAIMFDHERGLILGGADPREEGVAMGLFPAQ